MRKEERAKRQTLASVLDRLDAAEQRALLDLRAAGYTFQTIDRARRHQRTLIAVDRFNRDQDADALTAEFQPETARRTA